MKGKAPKQHFVHQSSNMSLTNYCSDHKSFVPRANRAFQKLVLLIFILLASYRNEKRDMILFLPVLNSSSWYTAAKDFVCLLSLNLWHRSAALNTGLPHLTQAVRVSAWWPYLTTYALHLWQVRGHSFPHVLLSLSVHLERCWVHTEAPLTGGWSAEMFLT